MFFLIFILLFSHDILSADVNLDTLKLVQIIFRHGERVPEYPYPTDPYNAEEFWQEGWAQLTERGKRQEYDLGSYLRSRYKTFVSDNYKAKELHVVSSDTDRTIMSAQLVLAGMFPTKNGTEWNPNLSWQPYPVHSISEPLDNLLRFKKPCKRYDQLMDDLLYNREDMVAINKNNAQLFEYLSNNSGVKIETIREIDSFYASMMVEELLGLEIPEWAKPVVHTENFQFLYNLSFVAQSYTRDMQRLRSGPLIGTLIGNMNSKVTNSSMKTKFYMFSAHDTTLVNTLNSLDILDLQRPPYASVFILELHQDTSGYFVNILYRNDTSRDPYEMHVPSCEFNCPLATFLQFANQLVPENWDAECNQSLNGEHIEMDVLNFVALIIVFIAILAFGFHIVDRVKNKSKGSIQSYEHLH